MTCVNGHVQIPENIYTNAGRQFCRPCRSDSTKRSQQVKLDYIREVKAGSCVDCGGQFHFSAMDFDHRPGELKGQIKNRGAFSLSWTLERIKAEIAKCDLLCAVCHRVRTYSRSQ